MQKSECQKKISRNNLTKRHMGDAAAILPTEASSNAAPRKVPLGVYFGSEADVSPTFMVPDIDWVFVTPEPSHPVALKHWPEDCCGRHLGLCNPTSFLRMFNDRLKDYVVDGEWRWKHTSGRTLQVFPNCTLEDVSAEAKKLLAQCTVAYIKGFLPEEAAFRSVCPLVHTAYVTPPCRGMKFTNEYTITDGDWNPCDGNDFTDYGNVPRKWIYEELYEELTDDDEESSTEDDLGMAN